MGYENSRGEDMDRIVARLRQARDEQEALNRRAREQLDAVALRPRAPYFVPCPPAHPGPAIFGPYTRPSRAALALAWFLERIADGLDWLTDLELSRRIYCAWMTLRHGRPF